MACYLVTLHVSKKLRLDRLFFGSDDVIVYSIDVKTELEYFFVESVRKRRRTKACGIRRESRRKRKDS